MQKRPTRQSPTSSPWKASTINLHHHSADQAGGEAAKVAARQTPQRPAEPLPFNFPRHFDAASWLTEESLEQSTLLKTKFAVGYDSASHKSLGQRTLLQASFSTNSPSYSTWQNDYQNVYAYDGKNRLASLTQSSQTGTGTNSVVANKHIVFGYNEHDQVIDVDRYANTSAANLVAHTDYTFDHIGRVTDIDHLKGSTHFAMYGLEYDARSRITAIDEVFSNSSRQWRNEKNASMWPRSFDRGRHSSA